MTTFTLNPLIASTSLSLCDFGVFNLRLVNDSRYLWLLLIPQIDGVTELHHLTPAQRHQMIDIASAIADIIQQKVAADKMNIATIGNIVPAMHLHIIARHEGDAAWPNPVWGNGAPIAMDDETAQNKRDEIHEWLSALSKAVIA